MGNVVTGDSDEEESNYVEDLNRYNSIVHNTNIQKTNKQKNNKQKLI